MYKLNKLLFSSLCYLLMINSEGCNNTENYSPIEEREKQVSKFSQMRSKQMESLGIMSSSDYLHWEQLGSQVISSGTMDNNNLTWAINVLKKPSRKPVIVDEFILGLFLSMKKFQPGQRSIIRNAVQPLLKYPDSNVDRFASGVMKKI